MAGPEPWINGMVDADTYDTERRLIEVTRTGNKPVFPRPMGR